MSMMLERWNDDKMDILDAKVNDLAADVRGLTVKVDRVDCELGDLRQDFRELRKQVKEGFESMNRTLVQTTVALTTAFVIGGSALIAAL
jgi:uncharacterized protein YoxC